MIRFSCLHYVSVTAVLFLSSAESLPAQMSAPLVGIIGGMGSTRNQIQPLSGVLGASTVGVPIRFEGDSLRAHLAPSGTVAILEQRSRIPALVTFSGVTAGKLQQIPGVLAGPVQVSFSPTGKSAVIRFRTGQIQVLTDLNGSPHVAYQTEFSDFMEIGSLAVSDDGSAVLAVTRAGMLYALGESAPPRLAYAGSRPLGVAFLANQKTAVVADGGSGTINLCRMAESAPSVQTVANVSFSGSDVLLEASLDGAAAFLAIAGDTRAYRINLQSGASQTITLPVPAKRLDRLRDGQSFVVSAEEGEPVWILTGNDSSLQSIFAANPGTPSPLVRMPAGKENRHE